MLCIVGEIPFSIRLNGDAIAGSIAKLLNSYNNLSLSHTVSSIKEDRGMYFVKYLGNTLAGCTAYRKDNETVAKSYHTSVLPAYRHANGYNLQTVMRKVKL